VVDELQINTVVNCGLRMVAALGKIVTTVDPMYVLRKNPLPRVMEHCTMSSFSLPNQCLKSSRRRWEDNIKIDVMNARVISPLLSL
jgi:hypothetical protein